MRTPQLWVLIALTLAGCAPAAVRPVAAFAPSPAAPTPEPPVTAMPQPTPLPPRRPIYIVDPNDQSTLSRILIVDPDQQQVAHTLTTRILPDIALSADGRRLYVADSYRTQVTRGEPRDVVSVYDALNAELLVDDVPVQKRLLYKGFPNDDPFLFPSEDGEHLYVMKYGDPDMHQLRLAALDAETLQTIYESAWPPCGHRLHIRADRWVCVNTTFPVQVSDGPEFSVSLSVDVIDPQRSAILETLLTVGDLRNGLGNVIPFDQDRRLYVIDGQANVTLIDLESRTATPAGPLEMNAGWQVVWLSAVLSADGKRLYLGFDTGDDEYQVFADAIAVYDPATWQRVATIDLPDRVTHFALSAAGDQLYAVSPFAQSLAIVETETDQPAALLSDLGGSPAAVIVPQVER